MRKGVLPPTLIPAQWDEAARATAGKRVPGFLSSTDHDGSETEAGFCEIRSWFPTCAN
jgi:hypothetical protein